MAIDDDLDPPLDKPDPPRVQQSVALSIGSIAFGGAALYFCLKGQEAAFIVSMLLSLGLAITNLIGGMVAEWRRCREYVRWVRKVRTAYPDRETSIPAARTVQKNVS